MNDLGKLDVPRRSLSVAVGHGGVSPCREQLRRPGFDCRRVFMRHGGTFRCRMGLLGKKLHPPPQLSC